MSLIARTPQRPASVISVPIATTPDVAELSTISETRYRLPLTTAATLWVQLRQRECRWYLACYEHEQSTQPRFLPVLLDAHLVNNTTEHGPCLFLICQNGEYEFQTTSSEQFERWKHILVACGVRELKFRDLYDILKFIGEGTFARVYLGKHRFTHEHVVVKAVEKRRVRDSNIYTEIKVLRKINHPYIIRLFAAYEQEDTVCLVLEHLKGGELFEWLSKKGRYSEAHAREAMRRILLAIESLHAMDIVHRDIKAENLILEQEGNPLSLKLIDFGLASILGSDSMRMRCGSPGYVAPEILEDRPYGTKVDIFSAGVILYTILAGFPPFRGTNVREILKKNLRGNLNFQHRCWEHVSAEAINLITLMTSKSPDRRCTATQALNHKWFGRTSVSAHPPRPASALNPVTVTTTPSHSPPTPAVPVLPTPAVAASLRASPSPQQPSRIVTPPRVAPEVAPVVPAEVVHVVRAPRTLPPPQCVQQDAASPSPITETSWLPDNTPPHTIIEPTVTRAPQQQQAVKSKAPATASPGSTASTASTLRPVSPGSSPGSSAASSHGSPPSLPHSRVAAGEPMWAALESPVVAPMGSPLNNMLSLLKLSDSTTANGTCAARPRCKTADPKTMQSTTGRAWCTSFTRESTSSMQPLRRTYSLPPNLTLPTLFGLPVVDDDESTRSFDLRWGDLLHTLTASIGCISTADDNDRDRRQCLWFGDDDTLSRAKWNQLLVTSQYFRACHSRSARSLGTSFCASPTVGPSYTPQHVPEPLTQVTDQQPQQRRQNHKTVRFSKSTIVEEPKEKLLTRPRLESAPPQCTSPVQGPSPIPTPTDMLADGSITPPPPVMACHEPQLLPPNEPTPHPGTGRTFSRSKTGPAPAAASPQNGSTGFNIGQFFRFSRRSRHSSNTSSSGTSHATTQHSRSLRARVLSRNASHA